MALSKIQAESMNLADTYAFSGTVSGTSLDHILTTDVSDGDASVIFNSTYITTAYRSYEVRITGYEPVTDATQLRCYPSIDNGSNFVATIQSGRLYRQVDNGSQNGMEAHSNNSYFQVGGNIGNDDNQTASAIVQLTGITSAVHRKWIFSKMVGKHNANAYMWNAGVNIPTNSAINYLKFQSSSGNITAGRFSLYGVKS